jgi:catechol 2,3-dioxygenase-like lactoylglutathione lyase family enzyme
MVAKNSISAVLVSTDLETSRGFYEDKVGLKLSPGTIKNHLLFDCGNGTTLRGSNEVRLSSRCDVEIRDMSEIGDKR